MAIPLETNSQLVNRSLHLAKVSKFLSCSCVDHFIQQYSRSFNILVVLTYDSTHLFIKVLVDCCIHYHIYLTLELHKGEV